MLTYDGTADVTIRENYLVATFDSYYFYVKSTNCFCIPVSLRCTDTAGDVWQYFELWDAYNDITIRVDSLCLHEPYNTIISIPRSELSNAKRPKVIAIDVRCSVCDADYPGMIELAISRPKELTDQVNTMRAISAYGSLEFSEFWKIWCAERYDGNAYITQLLFERIEQMDSVYFSRYGADNIFLWHGNGFRTRREYREAIWCRNGYRLCHRYLNATYRPKSLCYCISRRTTFDEDAGLIDDMDQLVATIPRNVHLLITCDDSPARHSVHRVCWDDEEVENTPYLEVGIEGSELGDRKTVIIVIQPSDARSSATDCPYRSESCAPWA